MSDNDFPKKLSSRLYRANNNSRSDFRPPMVVGDGYRGSRAQVFSRPQSSASSNSRNAPSRGSDSTNNASTSASSGNGSQIGDSRISDNS